MFLTLSHNFPSSESLQKFFTGHTQPFIENIINFHPVNTRHQAYILKPCLPVADHLSIREKSACLFK